jgi:arylsulfatase A-like enzyme
MKGPTHTFRKTKPNIVALPQLFKNHGYYTRSFGKILHHNGQDDPVSWTERRFWPPAEKYQHPDNRDCRITVDRPANHRNPLVEWADVADNVYQDGQTTDETIRTLRKVKDRPFMLMVGYMKPHTPLNAPKRYWDLYAPANIKLAPNPFKPKNAPDIAMNGFRYVRSFRDIPENGSIPDDVYRRVRHAYYACVSYIDAQVGVLLDELDRLKLTDNTVIVLWSDHGYQLGEHGMICKHTNFETSTKVPLVFSFPGQETRGLATNSFAELIDIYPTLAELCGLPRPDHLEGASLVPVLNDPKKHVKSAAFSQYPRGGAMGRSIRVARYRYTEWRQQKTKAIVARELYDHRTDPMENVNIAGDPSQAVMLERLSKQLRAGWRAAVVP